MRVNQDLSLEFSIVEHFVCCAKVSLFEILLVGSMTKEKVIRYTVSQIIYINNLVTVGN